MSETVHHFGTLKQIDIPGDKSINEFVTELMEMNGINIYDYYEDPLENLINESSEYFFHKKTGKLYKVNDKGCDSDDEIITAVRKDETTIEFNLKFYNGGASMMECMEEAMNKLEEE